MVNDTQDFLHLILLNKLHKINNNDAFLFSLKLYWLFIFFNDVLSGYKNSWLENLWRVAEIPKAVAAFAINKLNAFVFAVCTINKGGVDTPSCIQLRLFIEMNKKYFWWKAASSDIFYNVYVPAVWKG